MLHPVKRAELKAVYVLIFNLYHSLLANSADGKLVIFFLLFTENRIRHFMQIVVTGDNLHEMSNPFFLKLRKYFNMSSAEILLRMLSINSLTLDTSRQYFKNIFVFFSQKIKLAISLKLFSFE